MAKGGCYDNPWKQYIHVHTHDIQKKKLQICSVSVHSKVKSDWNDRLSDFGGSGPIIYLNRRSEEITFHVNSNIVNKKHLNEIEANFFLPGVYQLSVPSFSYTWWSRCNAFVIIHLYTAIDWTRREHTRKMYTLAFVGCCAIYHKRVFIYISFSFIHIHRNVYVICIHAIIFK